MRPSLGRSSLIAAAALAGAVVYWRATERRRATAATPEGSGTSAGDSATAGIGLPPVDEPFGQAHQGVSRTAG